MKAAYNLDDLKEYLATQPNSAETVQKIQDYIDAHRE